MLAQAIPKLPMRNKQFTLSYYQNKLEFVQLSDYGDYILFAKDQEEIHFSLFPNLQADENYGQVYSEPMILIHYTKHLLQSL